MMADFGIVCEANAKGQTLMRLNQWLLDRYRNGETAALIIDEAQSLSVDLLEEIRLLTNLETSTEKLLQIVLSGQPELEQKLREPQLRQLRQRITLRCRTHPLTAEETSAYIAQRLRLAGSNGLPIFSPEAVEVIFQYAQGIPRVTNLLCEHALINAFVDQKRPITADLIEEIALEFELNDVPPLAAEPSRPGGENVTMLEAVRMFAARRKVTRAAHATEISSEKKQS
jgi:type II secretory pathway predicted ATPase ExeA